MRHFCISFALLLFVNLAHAADDNFDEMLADTNAASEPSTELIKADNTSFRCSDINTKYVDVPDTMRTGGACKKETMLKHPEFFKGFLLPEDGQDRPYICCLVKNGGICPNSDVELKENDGKTAHDCSTSKCRNPRVNFCLHDAAAYADHLERPAKELLTLWDKLPLCCPKTKEDKTCAYAGSTYYHDEPSEGTCTANFGRCSKTDHKLLCGKKLTDETKSSCCEPKEDGLCPGGIYPFGLQGTNGLSDWIMKNAGKTVSEWKAACEELEKKTEMAGGETYINLNKCCAKAKMQIGKYYGDRLKPDYKGLSTTGCDSDKNCASDEFCGEVTSSFMTDAASKKMEPATGKACFKKFACPHPSKKIWPNLSQDKTYMCSRHTNCTGTDICVWGVIDANQDEIKEDFGMCCPKEHYDDLACPATLTPNSLNKDAGKIDPKITDNANCKGSGRIASKLDGTHATHVCCQFKAALAGNQTCKASYAGTAVTGQQMMDPKIGLPQTCPKDQKKPANEPKNKCGKGYCFEVEGLGANAPGVCCDIELCPDGLTPLSAVPLCNDKCMWNKESKALKNAHCIADKKGDKKCCPPKWEIQKDGMGVWAAGTPQGLRESKLDPARKCTISSDCGGYGTFCDEKEKLCYRLGNTDYGSNKYQKLCTNGKASDCEHADYKDYKWWCVPMGSTKGDYHCITPTTIEDNKKAAIIIITMSVVGLLLMLVVAALLLYQLKKKKSKKIQLEKMALIAEAEMKKMKKPKVVVHLPLELTDIETIYDKVQLTSEESKKRLRLLAQHILIFNPLEFLKVVGQMKYSYYLPNSEDTRGEPMKKEYDDLLAKYKEWQPSMPVVPVPAVEQDRSNGEINLDKEKQKLWDTVLNLKGHKKVALCLWSHDDLDSIYPSLLPFVEKETKKELEEIQREMGQIEEVERKQSGRVKKSTTTTSEPTEATISREQAPPVESTAATSTMAKPTENDPVKYIFPVGETQVYMDYFHKKYEPAGKEDEGMATVFPFYVLKKSKIWMREQLSFVVASAWPMRSLGEDKYLTFRALNWARKQMPGRKVYVLTDVQGHKEECAMIAQCLFDMIMEPSRPLITFLGACRLITARKQRSWDNGNMLLFLQRNLLFWAVDAGILKPDDPKLVNWDRIYRCMMLRSRATPSTRVYDPENLPSPPDLWPLEYNDQNRMKKAAIKDDELCGIWRCDMGRARPEPLTTAGRLGAPEPLRLIDKPIGFEAAWGKDAARDGGAQEAGNTTNSTTVTNPDPNHKKNSEKAKEDQDRDTFKRLTASSLRILATSANAKLNKRIRQLPKVITDDGGLSELDLRNLVNAKYDGQEFRGYRLASDIDNFVFSAPLRDSQYVRPQTRGYKWRPMDESRFNDKSKMALKQYKSQEDASKEKK